MVPGDEAVKLTGLERVLDGVAVMIEKRKALRRRK